MKLFKRSKEKQTNLKDNIQKSWKCCPNSLKSSLVETSLFQSWTPNYRHRNEVKLFNSEIFPVFERTLQNYRSCETWPDLWAILCWFFSSVQLIFWHFYVMHGQTFYCNPRIYSFHNKYTHNFIKRFPFAQPNIQKFVMRLTFRSSDWDRLPSNGFSFFFIIEREKTFSLFRKLNHVYYWWPLKPNQMKIIKN